MNGVDRRKFFDARTSFRIILFGSPSPEGGERESINKAKPARREENDNNDYGEQVAAVPVEIDIVFC